MNKMFYKYVGKMFYKLWVKHFTFWSQSLSVLLRMPSNLKSFHIPFQTIIKSLVQAHEVKLYYSKCHFKCIKSKHQKKKSTNTGLNNIYSLFTSYKSLEVMNFRARKCSRILKGLESFTFLIFHAYWEVSSWQRMTACLQVSFMSHTRRTAKARGAGTRAWGNMSINSASCSRL